MEGFAIGLTVSVILIMSSGLLWFALIQPIKQKISDFKLWLKYKFKK